MNFGTLKTEHKLWRQSESSESPKYYYPQLEMLLFSLHEFKSYCPGDVYLEDSGLCGYIK